MNLQGIIDAYESYQLCVKLYNEQHPETRVLQACRTFDIDTNTIHTEVHLIEGLETISPIETKRTQYGTEYRATINGIRCFQLN